jgi:hypothetical protein
MWKFSYVVALAGLSAALTVPSAADQTRADQALAQVNTSARAHYAKAKDAAFAALGPVIVVDAEAVTLVRNGTQQREAYLPVRYRHLKSLGHVALGLYSLLIPHVDHDIAAVRGELANYRAQVAALEPVIGELGLRWDDAKRQREIVAASVSLMDRVLAAGRITDDEMKAYTDEVGPALLGNAYDAAEAELGALHAIVQNWRAKMGNAGWSRLHVVVLGPARPRERHPPYEYFSRLLAADGAERLIYADNVTDVAGALDLLATTVNDRRMAQYFFADAKRFDHGLLRDATLRQLDKLLGK